MTQIRVRHVGYGHYAGEVDYLATNEVSTRGASDPPNEPRYLADADA